MSTVNLTPADLRKKMQPFAKAGAKLAAPQSGIAAELAAKRNQINLARTALGLPPIEEEEGQDLQSAAAPAKETAPQETYPREKVGTPGFGKVGAPEGEQRIDTSEMTRPLGSALSPARAATSAPSLGSALGSVPNPRKQLMDNAGLGSAFSFHKDGGKLDPDKVNVVGEDGPEEIVGDEVIPLNHTEERNPNSAYTPSAPQATGQSDPGSAFAAPDAMKILSDQRNAQAAGREEGGVAGQLSSTNAGGLPKAYVEPTHDDSYASAVISPREQAKHTVINHLMKSAGLPEIPALIQSPLLNQPAETINVKPETRPNVEGFQTDESGRQLMRTADGKWRDLTTGSIVDVPTASAPDAGVIKNAPDYDNSKVGTKENPFGRIDTSTPTDKSVTDLIAAPLPGAQPNMPTYTGRERVGKGTPGEAELHKEFLDRKAKYDRDIQAARDLGTTAGDDRAAHLEIAKADFEKHNPFGSTANHPGFLGKVEHGLALAGNIAGSAVAPGVMELIPGTDLNRAARKQSGFGQVQLADESMKAEAAARNATNKPLSPTELAAQHHDEARQLMGQIAAERQKPGNTPERTAELDNAAAQLTAQYPDLFPPERQEKEKPADATTLSDYINRVKALQLSSSAQNVYGTAPEGITKSELDKRYEKAAQLKGMNNQEAQNTIANQARIDQRKQHQDDLDRAREDKLVNYRDSNGDLVSGTRREALDAGVQEKDIHGATTDAAQQKARQAYTQYGRMIENAQDAANTLPVWQNEAERKLAVEVAKSYWDHMSGSVVVAGVGVNPDYLQQNINWEAYKKMSKQGQENMQNMFVLWSDALNVVKQETGGVPRGQEMLRKEDAILPHPDKTAAMNEKAVHGFVKRMRTDASEFARPSDMAPLRGGIIPPNAVDVKINGRDLGYATPEQQKKGTYTPWPKQ